MKTKITITSTSDEFDPVEDLIKAIQTIAPYILDNVEVCVDEICSGCEHPVEAHYGSDGMQCDMCNEERRNNHC